MTLGSLIAAPMTISAQETAVSQEQLEANKTLVRRYFEEALSQNKPELVPELFWPEFTFYVGGNVITGWEEIEDFITGVKTAFPDGTWTPQDLIAEGDIVAIRTSVSATMTGEFRGLAPTGKSASNVPAAAVFRVKDGKLFEAWGEDNFLSVGQQIGTAPAPFGPPVFTDNGSPVGPQTDQATRDANKAVVTRLIDEAWTGGNMAVIDELYAPDVVSRPTGAGQGTDLTAIKTGLGVYRVGIPDLKATIDVIAAEGDEVVTRFTLAGTNSGSLFALPPTNLPMETTGIRIDRLKDGKIVETWMMIDNLRLFTQLGVIPPAEDTSAATPAP
jgi:predicted ester cyclase